MRALRNDERELWRETMRGVKPLHRTKPPAAKPAPPPVEAKSRSKTKPPRAAAAPIEPAPAKKPAAGKAVATLDRRSAQKLKRGKLPIEARLDLHGMTQAEAHTALTRFLVRAQKDGVRAVLVITGKSGVLHSAVPRWLDDEVHRGRIHAASRAHAQHGGDGALYLLLRRPR